jgi:hypothetical protein
MMWSLTSRGAGRIGGSENFCSSPQKDFCNNIRQKLPLLKGRILPVNTVYRDTQESTARTNGGMNSAWLN